MKYLLIVFFLALGLNSFCQSDRFIFIQAKKDEPFYVRIGEKTFNSSSFGHLVIPRLNQEVVKLTVGYSKKSIPEQDFELRINGKDRGYELNQENGNQLFLYEWLTSTKIPTTTPPAVPSGLAVTGTKRSDPFAMLMAGVVNDSLVLFTEKPAVTADIAAANPVKNNPAPVQDPTIPPTEPFRRAVTPPVETLPDSVNDVVKNSPEVVDSTFLTDSSRNSTAVIEDKKEPAVAAISLIEESSSPDEKRMIFLVNETKEKIDVIIRKEADTIIQESRPVIKEVTAATDSSGDNSGMVIVNSDCQRIATDNDVDKLRVQLLKETTDDDRVFAARKVFRTKCFTVKQVTALTELFKEDASRYMFFDAAYPFVYDSGNFKSLISMLKEEYYINRFKALVRM